MLELKDLSLSFGNEKILEKINKKFLDGKLYIITGNSGSGKSSLLRSIIGIIPEIITGKVEGNIIFSKDNESLPMDNLDISERSKYLSAVFQNPRSQFYTTNSFDELAFPLENLNTKREEIFEIIEKYSKLLNIEGLLN